MIVLYINISGKPIAVLVHYWKYTMSGHYGNEDGQRHFRIGVIRAWLGLVKFSDLFCQLSHSLFLFPLKNFPIVFIFFQYHSCRRRLHTKSVGCFLDRESF